MSLSQKRTHSPKSITILGISIWTLAAIFFLYEFFSRTFVGTLAEGVMHSLHISAWLCCKLWHSIGRFNLLAITRSSQRVS